ncbi:3992_t:CDS:1, partial [Cetraspora pellucida]
MSKSHSDTKSHVSHIAQSYSNVKNKEQPHELHDKYVHPSANHDPKLKMPIEKESIKQ